MTGGHILAKSIIAVIEKMQTSCKDKQETIEMRRELEVIAVLELAKTQAKTTKELYESQIRLACTSIEKAVGKLIDCYTDDNKLLVQGLELMKNKQNVFIFILLTKVSIIQKRWLVAKCSKSKK